MKTFHLIAGFFAGLFASFLAGLRRLGLPAVAATLAVVLTAGLAWASDLEATIPNAEALDLIVKSLGGLKGASALGIAYVISQVVMIAFRSELALRTGLYRLLAVTGLNVVVGILGQMVAGQKFLPALLHSSVMAAVAIFLHQVGKQVVKVPDDARRIPGQA